MPPRRVALADFGASSLEKSGRTCSSVRSTFSTSWRRSAASTNSRTRGAETGRCRKRYTTPEVIWLATLDCSSAVPTTTSTRSGQVSRRRSASRGEISFDEHAVEQRHRDAAAVQVRDELRFGGDEDELVGGIDYAAQQTDERPVLRNCGDRHRRRSVGEHGRIEFRLRQHDGGDGALDKQRKTGDSGNLTRYVSLSGKAAPRPCAPINP